MLNCGCSSDHVALLLPSSSRFKPACLRNNETRSVLTYVMIIDRLCTAVRLIMKTAPGLISRRRRWGNMCAPLSTSPLSEQNHARTTGPVLWDGIITWRVQWEISFLCFGTVSCPWPRLKPSTLPCFKLRGEHVSKKNYHQNWNSFWK